MYMSTRPNARIYLAPDPISNTTAMVKLFLCILYFKNKIVTGGFCNSCYISCTSVVASQGQRGYELAPLCEIDQHRGLDIGIGLLIFGRSINTGFTTAGDIFIRGGLT